MTLTPSDIKYTTKEWVFDKDKELHGDYDFRIVEASKVADELDRAFASGHSDFIKILTDLRNTLRGNGK